MLKITITEKDQIELHYQRYNHPHPHVQKKMEALYLKSLDKGLSHALIAEIVGISQNTLLSYFYDYQIGGIEKLKEINFYRPQSKLVDHKETIEQYFLGHLPASLSEASVKIEQLTGIKRGLTQTGKYLKSIGMSLRKVGSIPGKSITEAKKKEQEEFKTKELDPRIKEAKEGKRKLYFVDAAHFVLGGFLACLWCFFRVYLPTPSGRQRYNVLGALDAITHQLIMECNDKYINSQSVCNLLLKLSQLQIGVLITIIMDNAKYQRCELVKSFAEKLNIELLFLPSYSPNLNIIERLWKWVKKDCLYCKYYEKFNDFKIAIDNSLSKVSLNENKTQFDSLFNLKFQMFSNSQYVTV